MNTEEEIENIAELMRNAHHRIKILQETKISIDGVDLLLDIEIQKFKLFLTMVAPIR